MRKFYFIQQDNKIKAIFNMSIYSMWQYTTPNIAQTKMKEESENV